jgi:hypothetical protein
MNNWKTSVFGTIAGIGALVAQSGAGVGLSPTVTGWAGVASAVSVLLLGLFAKDAKAGTPSAPTK